MKTPESAPGSDKNPFDRQFITKGPFSEGDRAEGGPSLSFSDPQEIEGGGYSVIGRINYLEDEYSKSLEQRGQELSTEEKKNLESYIEKLKEYEGQMLSRSVDDFKEMAQNGALEKRILGIEKALNSEVREQDESEKRMAETEMEQYRKHLETLKEAQEKFKEAA